MEGERVREIEGELEQLVRQCRDGGKAAGKCAGRMEKARTALRDFDLFMKLNRADAGLAEAFTGIEQRAGRILAKDLDCLRMGVVRLRAYPGSDDASGVDRGRRSV